MSNLGQAIEEEGIAIGEARIILNMYKNGFTTKQIAAASDKDIREMAGASRCRRIFIAHLWK